MREGRSIQYRKSETQVGTVQARKEAVMLVHSERGSNMEGGRMRVKWGWGVLLAAAEKQIQ